MTARRLPMDGIGGGSALAVRTPRLRLPAPPPPPVAGPFVRVLGIDPPQGWAVVDWSPGAGRGVHVASGELGDTDPHEELRALLHEHWPALVAIEAVARRDSRGEVIGGVYPKHGFGPRMAGDLYLAGWRAGELGLFARLAGFTVTTALEREVRDYWIRPKAPKGKADAAVADALRHLVPSWPAPRKTTTHERDAGLLAVYAGATAGAEASAHG